MYNFVTYGTKFCVFICKLMIFLPKKVKYTSRSIKF